MQRSADMQTLPAPRRPMTRFPIRSEIPMLATATFRADMQTSDRQCWMVRIELRRWYVPIRRWSRGLETLLADMQTFPLPDVLVVLRFPANLRYQARSLP